MLRTRSASASLTMILRSLVLYPSGAMPPTHRPLRLEAAILSRMRSEVTSRSNCAKDNSTLRVSRPIEVVVLNCWVTETNDTLYLSNNSTSLAKLHRAEQHLGTFKCRTKSQNPVRIHMQTFPAAAAAKAGKA